MKNVNQRKNDPHSARVPKTEPPLAEKDEEKAAEDRTREAQEEASVKAELKIRSKGKAGK